MCYKAQVDEGRDTRTINKSFHPIRSEYDRSVFKSIFIDRDFNYDMLSFVSVIVHIVDLKCIEILKIFL